MSVIKSRRSAPKNEFLAVLERTQLKVNKIVNKMNGKGYKLIGQYLADSASKAHSFAIEANYIFIGEDTSEEVFQSREQAFRSAIGELHVLYAQMNVLYFMHLDKRGFPDIRIAKKDTKANKLVAEIIAEATYAIEMIRKVLKSDKERWKRIIEKRNNNKLQEDKK